MSGLDPAAHRAEQRRPETVPGEPGDGRPPGALGTTGAAEQLLECVTGLVVNPPGLPVLHLLAGCGQCRNSLLYLLDVPRTPASNRTRILSRLRALPDRHQGSHGDPDGPDFRPPEIRWTP